MICALIRVLKYKAVLQHVGRSRARLTFEVFVVLCRLIAPDWLMQDNPSTRKVLEGIFTSGELKKYNEQGYNIYYLPNHPSTYHKGTTVSDIDVFEYLFVDYDCKTNTYPSKNDFIEAIFVSGINPTKIIDSGHGVHVYWKVSNLDAKVYLKLSRRLMRLFNTDEAVGQIFQLMRLPGYYNTKVKESYAECIQLYADNIQYTCEDLDKVLPHLTAEDEAYCNQHYDRTYNLDRNMTIDDKLPAKFGILLRNSPESKAIWSGDSTDRSKDDYRLGHIMFANGFTKEEAASVLVNSAKALSRAPIHRISYATNIIDKIWTFEEGPPGFELSNSVEDILKRSGDTLKGTRFKCHPRIDSTVHGFRLGQVIGLVAGSGVGKTAFALNMFRWFVQENPDYHHFFIPLEQPANEIADRWQTMCGSDTSAHKKVHVLSNYDDKGNFRHLSFDEIRVYIEKWQKVTGNKIGCIVIDHIGALKKKGSNNENQDLMTICHNMKAFAVQTNTLLVMQSQSNREKAGIGDLELNKDAAYGTMFFEAYCDYLITLWQPLKRCAMEPQCPTVTAFKFCKIRHKKSDKDVIQEDTPYFLRFDSNTEQMRDMTEDEITSFNFFLPKATNKRKIDRKTDLINYISVPYKDQPK
jgi:hypothetical protein